MPVLWQETLRKIDDYHWEIPLDYKGGMRVPGMIFASESMLNHIWEEDVFQQVANVACLPGIIGYSLAMPDIHWGYGFPIGGVAATRVSNGVISPGGVGFDINCGVRLLRTNLTEEEVRPKIKQLIDELFNNIPSGLGSTGKIKINEKELAKVLIKGSYWAIEKGFGEPEDIIVTEETGCIEGADPNKASSKSKKRGIPQLGTLGSGNHFLEIAIIDKIYDQNAATVMGISDIGQILVLIHTGSRGFGHQVCSDYVALTNNTVKKYDITLPDRQLACAPVQSPEGRDYLSAMACAANYAWANRQCITHWTRESFIKVFNKSRRALGLEQIYDVAHNIAKMEEHTINNDKYKLCVHRKGATRAFPAGHPDIPDIYQNIGQPVLIPGDMGRYSYVAVGTEQAMKETFGSTCHGAGRVQSRSAAKRALKGNDINNILLSKGITVKAGNMDSLSEESSEAYKDVSEVVNITQQTGISRKVIRTIPLGVIKG
ncbi:MAG: RtcB family protein [Dehalococcoidales bacterium]|nr:RtcB family protein [Dehalococcoidales bacterium]